MELLIYEKRIMTNINVKKTCSKRFGNVVFMQFAVCSVYGSEKNKQTASMNANKQKKK